jgi:ribosomal protein S18 acetylase RimI-like enzyme
MKYFIRKATVDDIPNIIELATKLVVHSISPFRDIPADKVMEYRKDDMKGLYQSLTNPTIGIFIAENEDKEFIGHVITMVDYLESSTGDRQGYIFDLSVKNEYQRLGIGKNLMDVAEEFCSIGGMKYICLNVTSGNVKAVNFYQKIGYGEERKRMIKVIKPKIYKNVINNKKTEEQNEKIEEKKEK